MNKMMTEVFWLRSIACLTIVLLHAMSSTVLLAELDPNSSAYILIRSLQLLMMYGTPMFVFISEFLISYQYRNGVKPGFLRKRVQFIFIPYVVMGLFYAWVFRGSHGLEAVLLKWKENVLLGTYHGYFILIIFQFYLLHLLLDRFLRKWNVKVVLFVAFIINAAHLVFFNFNEPQAYDIELLMWSRLNMLPFTAWLFYFAAGYYAGHHFEAFKQWIVKTRKWHLPFFILSAALVLTLQWTETVESISSKRFDVLFLTTAMMLLLFSLAQRLKKIPQWLVMISQYSFGIYLLHPFFQHELLLYLQDAPLTNNLFVLIALFFVAGVILPILVTYVLNRIPYGSYIAGKVGVGMKKRKQIKEENKTARPAA